MLQEYDFPVVPLLRTGADLSKQVVTDILRQQSAFADHAIEGIYIRVDSDSKLEMRAKVVRSDFIQDASKHWSKAGLIKNIVQF
jgi:hypothetical protein